ncbi:MAG TPA: molybdopterin molybdenumtransferase MoeA [Deltaproteobacteria bacterium]|nr:molybdopterin molybdenumtransferase MoeA [Deltaproteobacteria bacterium]
MLTYEEAKVTILAHARAQELEKVDFRNAVGRALAEDLVALEDQPPFDNSAVDGYAVKLKEIAKATEENPVVLRCQEYIFAGRLDTISLQEGECVQVATGAPLPQGTEAVVMREQVVRKEDQVYFSHPTKRGNNLRRRGRDMSIGDPLFRVGTTIAPTHLALLAAQGLVEVPLHRSLKINILSTGTELVDPTIKPGPGQIREANSFLLEALLQTEACEVTRLHRVVDDLEGTIKVLDEALKADALLISGGVSVGDSDFVKPALKELGVEEIFWRVKIKPGKPLFFGQLEDTKVFGLPGNPASTFVLFEELVRPYLRKCLGHQQLEVPMRSAKITEDFDETSERLQLLRAHWYHQDGIDWVRPVTQQGSFSIASIAQANSLIHMPEDSQPLRSGQSASVRPLAHRFALFG